MRIALVSPYSYTYAGGVGRHVEALAAEFAQCGHEVTLLAPYDPDDRLARLTHAGVSPQRRPVPDHLVPLGRTLGIAANGSMLTLALSVECFNRLSHELASGGYDVIHVHEPHAPGVSWCAADLARVPLVGTFHCYSTSAVSNNIAVLAGARRFYNRLHVRIAVSEAARWTNERFYGGRYRLIPNGVDRDAADTSPKKRSRELRLLFLGRADERKGLPVLLRAHDALRGAGLPVRLTVAGVAADEVGPLLLETEGVVLRGRVSEQEKWRLLHDADVLCAPSLGGESFGMVLTEAFASGTPVVCSNVGGYREVVRAGVDGLLVPPGDAVELAAALRALADDPDRRERMGTAARERAERFAWPHVAGEVLESYDDAIAIAARQRGLRRLAASAGLRPADGQPSVLPRRLASLEPPDPGAARRRVATLARRAAMATGAGAVVALSAVALERIGIRSILAALLAATPVWILVAFALTCLALLVRAEAWRTILRAALPEVTVRARDVARATMVGVLMSATLPARLGEPSRALIVARRLGRVRDHLPLVLGTVVSQTLLNILALVFLGAIMFATVGLFRGNLETLALATAAPLALLGAVLGAPMLLRGRGALRSRRLDRAVRSARQATTMVREGLEVFRRPRLGARAVALQLLAWTIQWIACYALLVAFGLEGAGVSAAAAVLFAVNVTAVLPLTPSNIGVFQAACVAVLSAYGVANGDALAYGIILQAVEIATAVMLGMPALVAEGTSWRDMRLRALHATPVELPARRRGATADPRAPLG